MAVLEIGSSSFDKFFKEFVKPGLNIELVKNTILYDRFKTKTDTIRGKYGVAKLLTATPKSARPSSSSTFPTARQSTYDEFIFYMKRAMYATLQFDGLALACAQGKGAIMDLVKAETEGIMYYIANRLNKQFWGDGSGRLAQVASAVSASTSVTVDGPTHGQDTNEYTNPSEYLSEGQPVDIYNGSGTLQAEEVVIDSISEGGAGTDTLTMESAVTVDDNSYIFDHDTYASSAASGSGVPMGLTGIISTSNPYAGVSQQSAFQGIDRSSYGFAQAQTWDESGVITSMNVLKMIQKCEKYGSIDVLLTNGPIWRNWYVVLEADKTMPNDPQYWGGTSGMGFYGGRKKIIPVIWDSDCPDGKMFALDDSKIFISSPDKSGMEWIKGNDGKVLTRLQGKDEFASNLRWYYNMTTVMPKALGMLYGITHTAS